jgi:hypothetical protein
VKREIRGLRLREGRFVDWPGWGIEGRWVTMVSRKGSPQGAVES